MKAIFLDLLGIEIHKCDDVPETVVIHGEAYPVRVITWGDRVFVKTPVVRGEFVVFHEVRAWACPDTFDASEERPHRLWGDCKSEDIQ